MLLTTLVTRINQKLAGELLTYKELIPHLDDVIDEINNTLNSIYPAFSELEALSTEYAFIPDRYIRSVIVPGAAWFFYVSDEEGMSTAQQYQMDYQKGLFYMLRDYVAQVPLEYQASVFDHSLQFQEDIDHGDRGIVIDGFGNLI